MYMYSSVSVVLLTQDGPTPPLSKCIFLLNEHWMTSYLFLKPWYIVNTLIHMFFKMKGFLHYKFVFQLPKEARLCTWKL